MDTRFIVPPPAPTVGLFRLFTKESLTKIERRIQEERAARRALDAETTGAAANTHDDKVLFLTRRHTGRYTDRQTDTR